VGVTGRKGDGYLATNSVIGKEGRPVDQELQKSESEINFGLWLQIRSLILHHGAQRHNAIRNGFYFTRSVVVLLVPIISSAGFSTRTKVHYIASYKLPTWQTTSPVIVFSRNYSGLSKPGLVHMQD
jgi:hypothetical protein